MKFLLINPRTVSYYGQISSYPLGLSYIASSLRSAGHLVKCINLNIVENPEQAIKSAVIEFDPDACGTGAVSIHFGKVQAVLSFVRQIKPTIINIVGNTCFNVEPEISMKFLDADIGVYGEGEETIVELAEMLEKKIDISKVKGITFRTKDNQLFHTPKRKPINNLETISRPDYDDFGLQTLESFVSQSFTTSLNPHYDPRRIQIISSRSCVYQCTFCFHPLGRVRRERDIDDFFDELNSAVRKYNINTVEIVDSLFSAKKDKVYQFCERMKMLKVSWQIQLHMNLVDDDLLKTLKDSNCTLISYGIESMNKTVLKSMRKKLSPDRIQEVLELTYKNRIEIQGLLIFGDLAETVETANESIHWWANNRHFYVGPRILMTYPGSHIFNEAIKAGRIDPVSAIVKPKPYINIARMNNATWKDFYYKINAFRELVNHVEPVKYFIQRFENPIKGKLMSLTWNCPRCTHSNVIVDIPFMFANTIVQYFLMSCQECCARYSVRNPLQLRLKNKTVDKLMENYYRTSSLSYLLEIQRKWPFHAPSAFEIGKYGLKTGNLQLALEGYSRAVTKDIYNPGYAMAYAEVLRYQGCYGAAKLYYDQILSINPNHQDAKEQLTEITKPGNEDKLRTYFLEIEE